MSVPEILKTIGDQFQSGATVKNVYGEPVIHGNRTVIPVARVSYGFGGGGGARPGSKIPQGDGGGGGGRVSAVPAGVVEITNAGTRFVPFNDWKKLTSLAVISLAIGFLIGARQA